MRIGALFGRTKNSVSVFKYNYQHIDIHVLQIDALPEIVEAVKGTGVEVYLDGGVRLGTDVLKAIALGARAVFVGRPILWGLGLDVSCSGKIYSHLS